MRRRYLNAVDALPESVKRLLRPLGLRLLSKRAAELAFWQARFDREGGRFYNAHYQRLMLAMAGEPDGSFLRGKIVADFGCGPRGSLVWANEAALRVGVDVLADEYTAAFPAELTRHGMVYVKSTERVIPLPSGFVDVLFTLNAMDHVAHFDVMCDEIVRILKPGGLFIGSFNIEHTPKRTEPQRLTEATIDEVILSRLHVETRRISPAGEAAYEGFFDASPQHYRRGEEGFLWVRARKVGE